jgi:hypothetical protein
VYAFRERIRKSAKVKRDATIAEVEEKERERRIAASPGGIDPKEVYNNLPEVWHCGLVKILRIPC